MFQEQTHLSQTENVRGSHLLWRRKQKTRRKAKRAAVTEEKTAVMTAAAVEVAARRCMQEPLLGQPPG